MLPKKSEDAIFVTLQVDWQFLWVDRLGIDQANLEEKHATTKNMDQVYRGAKLTIVASVGDRSD